MPSVTRAPLYLGPSWRSRLRTGWNFMKRGVCYCTAIVLLLYCYCTVQVYGAFVHWKDSNMVLLQSSAEAQTQLRWVGLALFFMENDVNRRLPQWKMILIEDYLNWRLLKWRITSVEDYVNGRVNQWKMVFLEDDFTGRRSQLKTTSMEDDPNARPLQYIKLSLLGQINVIY